MSLERLVGGKRFVASFSGGKDSTLSVYRALQAGGKLEALMTTMNKERQGSYSHCISRDHLNSLASLMGSSAHLIETDSGHYRQDLVDCLRCFSAAGVEAAVFGDIDLAGHREWIESVCGEAGITAVFPLWQEDRRAVVEEFIGLGFRAVVKVVDLACLDTSFLGRVLDASMLQEFDQKGIDICGENGEYHTLVVDGPLLAELLVYEVETVVKENGYGILILR